MVYLIHFAKPLAGHAQHYIGFCEGTGEDSLEARIERHRYGDGARILRAATLAGISWRVVRTWSDGDRSFERKLKNQKNAWRFCPVCAKNHVKNLRARRIA